MGCWNKTCGLSNLHIYAGDHVYVFVLEKAEQDLHPDFCYSTSFYRPLLLPFRSEYNDYGGGENSSGPAFELIMSSISEKLVEMPLGDNRYHDIAVTRDGFGESMFFDAVHEGRLKVQAPFSEPVNLYFTMMREDIVNSVLANWRQKEYLGQGQGQTGYLNSYVEYGFQDILDDLPTLLNHLELRMHEDTFMGIIKFDNDIWGHKLEYNPKTINRAAKWLGRDTRYQYSRLIDINAIILQMMINNQKDAVRELLTEHLKGIYIDAFMHATRRSWLPGAHEGSQNVDQHGHRVLVDAVIKALDDELEEYKREFGDEEEC